MDLTEYQLLYVQTVYNYFRETLQWPTFRQVQGKILPTHRDFRVVKVAESIEDNPARHFYQNLDTQAAITLREIHQLPEAKQDLVDLLKLINYSVEKYLTEDKEVVRVTSEEVSQNLHFDEATIRKMFQLLGLTTGIIGSSSNSLDYKTWSTPSYVLKKQIAPEVINAISDPKIKQICEELNNTPAQNVLSLAQGLGEALQWTLWYRTQQFGTSMTVSNMKLSRLLEDAINHPYYSSNAAIKFLKDFKYGFLKTGYDMVRHDPAYIPDIVVLNPAIDALEHVLKETFPI